MDDVMRMLTQLSSQMGTIQADNQALRRELSTVSATLASEQMRANALQAEVTASRQEAAAAIHAASEARQTASSSSGGLPPEVIAALVSIPDAVKDTRSKSSLVDQKGLGKPSRFAGGEENWTQWDRRITNYAAGVLPHARTLIA